MQILLKLKTCQIVPALCARLAEGKTPQYIEPRSSVRIGTSASLALLLRTLSLLSEEESQVLILPVTLSLY